MDSYESQEALILQKAQENGISQKEVNSYFTKILEEVTANCSAQKNNSSWLLGRTEYLTWEHFFHGEPFPGKLIIKADKIVSKANNKVSESGGGSMAMSTTLRDIDEAPGRIMAPTKTNNKAERGILPHASLPLSQNGSPTKAVMFTKGKSLTSLGSSQMRPGTGRNSGLLDITNRSTSAQDKSPKGRLERVKSLSADRWDLDLIIHRAEAHGHDKYEVRQKFKKELQYAQETYPSESQAWHQWLAESLTYNVYFRGQAIYPKQEPPRPPKPIENHSHSENVPRRVDSWVPPSCSRVYPKKRDPWVKDGPLDSLGDEAFGSSSTIPSQNYPQAGVKDSGGQRVLSSVPQSGNSAGDVKPLPVIVPSLGIYEPKEGYMEQKAKEYGGNVLRTRFFQTLQKNRDAARVRHGGCARDYRHWEADSRTWASIFPNEPFPWSEPKGLHVHVCGEENHSDFGGHFEENKHSEMKKALGQSVTSRKPLETESLTNQASDNNSRTILIGQSTLQTKAFDIANLGITESVIGNIEKELNCKIIWNLSSTEPIIGLFVMNVSNDVRKLFSKEDKAQITKIEKWGGSNQVVHFLSIDARDATFARLPEKYKSRSIEDPCQPLVKLFASKGNNASKVEIHKAFDHDEPLIFHIEPRSPSDKQSVHKAYDFLEAWKQKVLRSSEPFKLSRFWKEYHLPATERGLLSFSQKEQEKNSKAPEKITIFVGRRVFYCPPTLYESLTYSWLKSPSPEGALKGSVVIKDLGWTLNFIEKARGGGIIFWVSTADGSKAPKNGEDFLEAWIQKAEGLFSQNSQIPSVHEFWEEYNAARKMSLDTTPSCIALECANENLEQDFTQDVKEADAEPSGLDWLETFWAEYSAAFKATDIDRLIIEEAARAEGSLRMVLDEVTGEIVNVKELQRRIESRILQSAQNETVLQEAEQGVRLCIGNLEYATTVEDLKAFFHSYTVEAVSIPKNLRTNRPVGHAFVSLSTFSEAERAISELSGKKILERKVSVQHCKAISDSDSAGGGGDTDSVASLWKSRSQGLRERGNKNLEELTGLKPQGGEKAQKEKRKGDEMVGVNREKRIKMKDDY